MLTVQILLGNCKNWWPLDWVVFRAGSHNFLVFGGGMRGGHTRLFVLFSKGPSNILDLCVGYVAYILST